MNTRYEKAQYVEEMGLAMEAFGMPRMWGRVLGALLLADPPEQTAEQLAATLQASRGSISTATRMLEQASLIERLRRPGERKDSFRNRPGAWQEINRRRSEATRTLIALAEKGLELVDSDDPEVRRGLDEMLAFMRFLEREYPKIFSAYGRELAKERCGDATGAREALVRS